MAGMASLRQSSRTKKPSRRAEEMHQAESLEAVITTKAVSTTKSQKGGIRQAGKVATRRTASEEVHEEDGGEYKEEEESGDEEEAEEASAEGDPASDQEAEEPESAEGGVKQERQGSDDVYCLCRKGDDGRPMVFCAECNDWFHFKCVGLTKKVAENLSEYICPPCGEKTGKKSKTLDDNHADEWTDTADKEESESATPPPPRRSSAATKRQSSEEEEDKMPRKRSRSSSQLNSSRKVSNASRTALPEPIRKTSGSQITAATGSTAVMKARSETLRKHAREQLSATFDAIFAEAEDASNDGSEAERGSKYAFKFEASLFDLNSETIAKTTIRTAGKLYRDRLRTFLFNLKDKSNTSLRQKIVSEEVKADALAAMDNDALANDDIRKEVERRKKENLEQSILKKEVAPLRKLTHKGEIDIDFEAAQMSRLVADRETEKDNKVIREESATPIEAKNEALDVSPIKVAAPFGSPHTAPPRRMTSSAQSPTMQFDFGNVWTGEEAKEKTDDEDIEQIEERNAGEGEAIIADGKSPIEEHADNFIDDFLGMPEEKQDTTKEEDPQAAIPKDDAKWRGVISMPEEGICTGKVRQVAGRPLTDHDWNSLFPSSHCIIEGRLPTSSGAPYLVQSKLAPRTELVVMTFEQSWESEAVAQLAETFVAPSNNDDNARCFDKLLSYFDRRDRYGVLPPLASARGVLVKDFYITPLLKNTRIPQWMDMMQASEFQGESSYSRDRDMFLLVAVLFKQVPIRPSDVSPPQIASSSAPNLSSILGPGSNTLQDLLKAVGGGGSAGNKSPATPLANNGYQSPASQVHTLDQAIMQHQPSIDTLREMPRPQLEEMMHNNPNLVDQLLKTLNATKAPSPGPLARPPGPPPPPPPGMQRPPYHVPDFNSYGQQQLYLPPPPSSSSYGYQYQNPPQASYPPQGAYPSTAEQQDWRPSHNGYPTASYNQASPPHPSGYRPPLPSNYGPPSARGGYNRGGAPPGQRRY